MCNDWKNDFIDFYNLAIKNGYKDTLTIDRINNNGNYEPTNCRWISAKVQNRNTRRNVFLIYNNEKRCVAEWAEMLGISKETLYGRIKKGWAIERILTK